MQAAEDELKDRHRYVSDDAPPSEINWGWWDWLSSGNDFLVPLLQWIFWILLALLIVALGVYFWPAIEPSWYERSRRRRGTEVGDSKSEQAKIVDLPFNIDTPVQGLLGQAETCRLAGDYSRAIVYLFSHVLVELDDADCIRLQRGKTNRVYLQELKEQPRLVEVHRYLMQNFEAVFFGRYVVSREQCDRCWSLLPSINQAIQEVKQRRTLTNRSELAVSSVSLSEDSLKNGLASLTLIWMLVFVGCNRNPSLPIDEYGESSYGNSHKSVSGLSVFRALCEERGSRTFELKSLSQRTQKLDTVLWAPKDYRVPSPKEIRWFDDWLSANPSRTLVIVGRDYSPAAHYWQQAANAANPEDRRTFRLRQAYAETEIEAARSLVDTKDMDCPWFEQELTPAVPRRVEKFRGPWSKDFDPAETSVILRGSLLPSETSRTSVSAEKKATASISAMAQFDDGTDIEIDPVSYGPPTIQTFLMSADGTPIISSIAYEPWGSSRLILVANGSVLMNEAIVMTGNQKLAERLIGEFAPQGRVGFLSNANETWIRAPWDEQEPKGFELMRVWPLSLISIQGLFLGFIGLLAMLPIFGRPQRLPVPSTADFGKHIEALGDLLLRARDRNYALQRIADYFREVRRDSASPWANVAPPDDSSFPSSPLTPIPDPIASPVLGETPWTDSQPVQPSTFNH